MAATVMKKTEEDIRTKMLNTFMACPHRDTDKVKDIHEELQEKDPLFYAHLASWYKRNGELRDHNEVFCALLTCDNYIDNRETGLALFRDQPPFMKSKILGFIKGKKVKLRKKTGKKKKIGRKMVDEVTIEEKSVGLKRAVPTALKTEVRNYLRWLESDPARFDGTATRNFKDLKFLYAANGLQIRPCPRAQQILFERKYPEDSKLNVYEKISNAKRPQDAAKLIVENKIPYTVAVGLVEKITPSILVALINNMSPQEVINNVASLQEKGAFDNTETKKLVEAKLEKAKKSRNVSALKSKTAKSTGRVKDKAIAKALDDVADVQVKQSGQIKIPTAIFVDRSGSMDRAIEVGKSVAALVSGASESDLYVVAFDTAAQEVKSQGKAMSDWERAFRPIRAGGGTSIGCALDFMIRKGYYAEQIVVITDEGENQGPYFHQVYPKYQEKFKVSPHVTIIQIDTWGGSAFSRYLTQAKIDFDTYKPDGKDYYGLPGLLKLLSRKSTLDLVYEIMETPLVTRRPFK